MNIELTKILTESQIKKLDATSIKVISEACNNEISNKIAEFEKTNSAKFESFINELVKKYDARVDSVINESVKSNIIGTANEKLFSVLKDMANILESAGIPVTETTKLAQLKLQESDKKLVDAFKERETLKRELDNAEKERYIMSRLQGMKPEIVSHALEHFKNRDILDVQDEIGNFLDGDFSELIPDTDHDRFSNKDIELNQVKDALAEIERGNNNNSIMQSIKGNAKFESLNKNLNLKKVLGVNKDITTELLIESEQNDSTMMDKDARDAMAKIQDFSNLGYKFR